MFNQSFVQVQKALPRLQRLGFSHVLISPPQKSNASRSWWGRYQPVDFTVIQGPLGGRQQLQDLCWQAAGRGLSVVVDTVLNHMSNEPRYVMAHRGQIHHAQFPRFSRNDFQPRLSHSHGKGRGLPDLRTDSPWVRQELKAYLHMLFELGVRGFRFDAAKHIDPEFFAHLLRDLPALLSWGELVYASARDFPNDYFKLMKAYDFPLAHTLKEAFAPGGDLARLMHPADAGGALWGPQAVTFVNHHDLIKNRRSFSYFRVDDLRDRDLAYVYLLAREEGTPCVYSGDLRSAYVKAGLAFHQAATGQPQTWLRASHCCLLWRRGPRLLAGINKSASDWLGHAFHAALAPGDYRDLLGGPDHWVDEQGRFPVVRVPARGAILLQRR